MLAGHFSEGRKNGTSIADNRYLAYNEWMEFVKNASHLASEKAIHSKRRINNLSRLGIEDIINFDLLLNIQAGHNDGKMVRTQAMNGKVKHYHLATDTMAGALLMVTVLLGCCMGIVQCSKAEVNEKIAATQVSQTVVHGGYTIQLFSTPEEQLRHALAWFSDPYEKKASLEVLIDTFPDARNVRADAELELA